MLLGGVLAFLSLGMLPGGAWAAGESKLANKTIERVSSLSAGLIEPFLACERTVSLFVQAFPSVQIGHLGKAEVPRL